MKYKKIYNAQREVSAIGMGCMGIGGYLSKNFENDDKYIKSLQMGVDLGMTFIDTAECYGSGYSEEIVGMAIEDRRDKVFISTKVSPEHLSYNDVIESAEKSLKRLKISCIDLYQIHWPNPNISINETINAFEKLVKDGKIKYIGVSNFSLNELKEAEKHLSGNLIVSIQLEYNLFDRTIEKTILPYCEQKNIVIIAYSPLDQGRIADGNEKIRKLKEIADRYNKTMAQVALNWLIEHPVVVAIPKAVNPVHLKENAAASDFSLSENDFEELNNIFKEEVEYVSTDRICVIPGGQGNRQVYQTLGEALENKLCFSPSPADLAKEIIKGDVLKPVRGVKTADNTGKYDYDLIEGRLRYWAWVIAYNGEKPIPVIVRGG